MTTTPTNDARALILAIGGTAATAHLTGINARTVGRWLSGATEPAPDSLALLRELAASRALPPFRARLQAARAAAGLTQAQAAAAVSPLLSIRTYQSWEVAGAHPPYEWTHDFILSQIARAARIPE